MPSPAHAVHRYQRCRAAARRLRVPSLLVRGERSEIVSDAAARKFVAAVAHARRFDVPNATHMVAGDDNAGFAAAILDFLGDMSSPRHEG